MRTAGRLSWVGCGVGLALVGVAALASCTGRAPRPRPWIETSVTEAPGDSSSNEDQLRDADLPDETGHEAAASEASDAVPDRWRAGRCEFSAITGYRSETRLRLDRWGGFSGGVRVGESFATGFVRFDGRGVVRGIHIGRMAVRAGQRLLLGRGLGAYGSSGSGSVRRGVAVSPSLSKWFGVTGAALELGQGPWRFQTLALASPGGTDPLDPVCLWGSVVRDFTQGSVGVLGAYSFPPSSEIASGPTETRLSVVGGHAVIHGDGFEGSAEAARLGKELFFAGRFIKRGRTHRGSLFVYRAPYEMPPEGAGAEPPAKRDQGMAVALSSRVAGVRGSAVWTAGQVGSRSGRDTYRRLIAQVENRGSAPVHWSLRAYMKCNRRGDFSAGVVVRDIPEESSRDLTFRAAVSVRGGESAQTTARIDYLPATDGTGPGTLVSLSTEVTVSRADVRVSLSGHSLDGGRRAFVSRPGLGPFEWFGSLYGRGSDAAIRFRLRLTPGSRLLFFYGSSWRGGGRVYIGAEHTR